MYQFCTCINKYTMNICGLWRYKHLRMAVCSGVESWGLHEHSKMYYLFRINVAENNFFHMGNQTQGLGTNCWAYRSRMLNHYTKSLGKKLSSSMHSSYIWPCGILFIVDIIWGSDRACWDILSSAGTPGRGPQR